MGSKIVPSEKQDDEAEKIYEVKGNSGELLVDLHPIGGEKEWEDISMKEVSYKGIAICTEDVLDSKVRHARKHCQGKLRAQDLHDFISSGKTPPSK